MRDGVFLCVRKESPRNLASGNVIFESNDNEDALRTKIENEIETRIVILSDTINEAFEYIKEKVYEGNLESLYTMTYDAIYSIHSIQLTMVPFIKKLPPDNIETLTVELNKGLNLLVSACERKDINNAYSALNDKLIHAYENWQNELRANMNQYTLS